MKNKLGREDVREIFLNIVLIISFSVLGFCVSHYETNIPLLKYDIALMAMLVSGIWLYRKDGKKELNKAILQDTIVAILLPIVMKMMMNENFDAVGFKSSLGSILHALILKLAVWNLDKRLIPLVGERAYITFSLSLILMIILIALGWNITLSVAVGIIALEPINYMGFKKKINSSK